jgi:hypothetical protein
MSPLRRLSCSLAAVLFLLAGPAGTSMTYGAGHVHGILLDGEEVVSFERDDLHREVERTFRKSGLLHTQRYDPAGRLKEQVLAFSPDKTGEDLNRTTAQNGQRFKRAYAHDRAGQLTRIQDNGKGA